MTDIDVEDVFEKCSPRGVYDCGLRRKDGLCKYLGEEMPDGAFLYGGQRHCRIRPGGKDNFDKCDIGENNIVKIGMVEPLRVKGSNICY